MPILSQGIKTHLLVILTGLVESGLEHIDGDAGDRKPVGREGQRECFHPREGLKFYLAAIRKMSFIEIFADTSACVAAHLGFGAVGIEDTHREVGSAQYRGLPDKHQTIAPDACVAVAPLHRRRLRVGNGVAGGVDIDVVVAGTVHLGKVYPVVHRFSQSYDCKST